MNKIAIITGASSGIGKEFAKHIYEKDNSINQIWVVARREDRLINLKEELGEKIIPVVCDLSVDSGIEVIKNKLQSEQPEIKLLINSAGLGIRGKTKEISEDSIKDTIEVNCVTLSILCRICLDYMKSGSGIINVASSAGFLPQKGFATYSASKAYVLNFSQALYYELKKDGIKVLAVAPGPVNTEFQKVSTGKDDFEGFRAKIVADPKTLVLKSYKAFAAGKPLYCHGFAQKCLHVLSKLLPIGLMEIFIKD